MKQTISPLLIFIAIFLYKGEAKAQVTIKATMMPKAGSNIIYTTSNDSIDVSQTGPGQIWDFSGVTPVSQDTYKYVSPIAASPLYGLAFYGDVALDDKVPGLSGVFNFYKTPVTGTDYQQDGMGVTLPVLKVPAAISYTKPDYIYRFPLSYGKKQDSCFFTGSTTVSGFSVKIAGKRVNTVDGYGSVKTPYKTYSCIRVKSVVTELDTFLIIPINNSRIEYKWLSTSEMIPVMEAVVTRNMTNGKTTMVLHYKDSYHSNINPNGPLVNFNVADTNTMTKDTVSFKNMTSNALGYNWTIIPGTYTFAGGGANTKNPKVIFDASGLYSVSLTATNISGSNILVKKNYINVTHNTGIALSTTENDCSIYPNPVKDVLYIHFDSPQKNCRIIVLDITGKKLIEKMVDTDGKELLFPTTNMKPGIYLLNMISNGKISRGKIIKE
jgi:PKD repeat protein